MHTKNIVLVLLLMLVGIAVYFVMNDREREELPRVSNEIQNGGTETPRGEAVAVVADDLEIPWDIAFLPDKSMLVTERPGRLQHIDASGARKEIAPGDVIHKGESGLLGIVLHPNFSQNQLLYLYMTAPGTGEQTVNRVLRYRFASGALTDSKVIIDNIPGAIYHDGGRMEFGPDGKLYITTGDATEPAIAQDLNSLGGKILRLNDDGTFPEDNPFVTRSSVQAGAVYSYGHRNPQGLAWDAEGNLWETEHGRSGVQSGLDEVNRIERGQNYGWPDSEGDRVVRGTIAPALHSGTGDTWAPASAAVLGNSLFFGGLRGETLYEAILENGRIKTLKRHFAGAYGRIRTVRVGPDDMLYITTSNRDGRGDAQSGDDKIIRIDPKQLL